MRLALQAPASLGTTAEVLLQACPNWSDKEHVAANDKLARAGVETVGTLVVSLTARGNRGLNAKLKAMGVKTFSSETLCAMRRTLGLPEPAAELVTPRLRNALQECSVSCDWNHSDFKAAEEKLSTLGATSAAAFLNIFSELGASGLNSELRVYGMKQFARETLFQLRRETLISVFGEASVNLEDFLQIHTDWGLSDVIAATDKLRKIGIHSLESLKKALTHDGMDTLNKRLQAADQKSFSGSTLASWCRTLGIRKRRKASRKGQEDGVRELAPLRGRSTKKAERKLPSLHQKQKDGKREDEGFTNFREPQGVVGGGQKLQEDQKAAVLILAQVAAHDPQRSNVWKFASGRPPAQDHEANGISTSSSGEVDDVVAAHNELEELMSMLMELESKRPVGSMHLGNESTNGNDRNADYQALRRRSRSLEPPEDLWHQVDHTLQASDDEPASCSEARIESKQSSPAGDGDIRAESAEHEVQVSTAELYEAQTISIETPLTRDENHITIEPGDHELLLSGESCVSSLDATAESYEGKQSRGLKEAADSVERQELVSRPVQVLHAEPQVQSVEAAGATPALEYMTTPSVGLPVASSTAPSDRLQGDFFQLVDCHLSTSGEQQDFFSLPPAESHQALSTRSDEASTELVDDQVAVSDEAQTAYLESQDESNEALSSNSTDHATDSLDSQVPLASHAERSSSLDLHSERKESFSTRLVEDEPLDYEVLLTSDHQHVPSIDSQIESNEFSPDRAESHEAFDSGDHDLLVFGETCASSLKTNVENYEGARSRNIDDPFNAVECEMLLPRPQQVLSSTPRVQGNDMPSSRNMEESYRLIDDTSPAQFLKEACVASPRNPKSLNLIASSPELQEVSTTPPSAMFQEHVFRVADCKLSVSYAQQTLTLRQGHQDFVCRSERTSSSKSQAQRTEAFSSRRAEESAEPIDDNMTARLSTTGSCVIHDHRRIGVIFHNGTRYSRKLKIVPMGHMCPTAFFLNARGWRTESLPLDWCCATFKVWDHILRDNFSTILPPPVIKGNTLIHPYDLEFQDTLMFLHHPGWANDLKTQATMTKRVERLQRILRSRNAFGLAFYYEGKENVHQTLHDLVADATKLAQPMRGFQHIVLVWFNQTWSHRPKFAWSAINPHLTVLKYTPRSVMGWGLDMSHTDTTSVARLLKERFPFVFSEASIDKKALSLLLPEDDGDPYAGWDIDWNLAWDFERGQRRL